MKIKDIKVNEEGLYFYPKELKDEIIKPSFKASKTVQILAGYFSIDSFLVIIDGLEVFFNNDGVVNIIIGVPKSGLDPHNKKLIEAIKLSESNDEIVKAYGDEIVYQAGQLKNELRKDRIRTFAYLIKKGSVRVKFAILKDGHVHSKVFIFEDAEDGLAVSGAANFSVNAFESDHNNTHVVQSYEDEKTLKQFQKLKDKVQRYWDNKSDWDAQCGFTDCLRRRPAPAFPARSACACLPPIHRMNGGISICRSNGTQSGLCGAP